MLKGRRRLRVKGTEKQTASRLCRECCAGRLCVECTDGAVDSKAPNWDNIEYWDSVIEIAFLEDW